MTNSKLAQYGFMHALGAAAYIALVAFIMSNGEKWFGSGPDNVFAPIAMLLLLVLSAAVMGALVLLRPAIWFMNGQKGEAVKLFFWTVGWIFVFMVAAFAFLIVQ